MTRPHHRTRRLATCLTGALALTGCATPVFREASSVAGSPGHVAAEAARYEGAEVVWGGKILDVRNGATASEIQVAALPVDRAQRPDPSARAAGRFLIELPGFVEPLDWPPGRFVTVHGRVHGTRTRLIDGRDYTYPVVTQAEVHLWPENFPRERGRVSFGIGVGVGIR
jgi:outer membrane lipoprotein